MELPIHKWGKSAAVRLPPELLRLLKVSLGDKLSVNVQPDGILLKAARPSYSLGDLVAQCDLTAAEPKDIAMWSNMKPVGRESR